MSVTRRVLVVDDDPHIRDVICFALKNAGMATIVARNGTEALASCGDRLPDLIILDISMPEIDGLEVCRKLRRTSDVPILFLSARDDEIDRVLGLEIGGDDYVTKPFSPRELVARVNVILKRRVSAPLADPAEDRPLSRGCLQLDSARHRAEVHGRHVALTSIEFAIVKALLGKPDIVFSRTRIMQAAYGTNIHVADRTIDSHIRNVRAKLIDAGCANPVETVRGIGFRLGTCEEHG